MSLQQLADRHRRVDVDRSPLLTVAEAARRAPVRRLRTRLPWLDHMLGGGFVQGSVAMFHGEPGAGKSTLLAQAAGAIPGSAYVSAEEDISQVAARFVRLGLSCNLLGETDMATAFAAVSGAPFVVLDSVQAMRPAGVAAAQLAVDYARANHVAVAIVCHETKGGKFAGLMTIEHLIDTTIKVGRGPPRFVTTEKNRYGEAGISLLLQMTEKGLVI